MNTRHAHGKTGSATSLSANVVCSAKKGAQTKAYGDGVVNPCLEMDWLGVLADVMCIKLDRIARSVLAPPGRLVVGPFIMSAFQDCLSIRIKTPS